MKIAHFVAVLKNEDGVGLVLQDLARESVAKGDEVIIVTGHVDSGFAIQASIIQTPAISVPLYKEYKIPVSSIRKFEKDLQNFNPDIIHIHSPESSAWMAIKYAKKHRVPVIATYHTDFGRYLSYFHIQWLTPVLWVYLRWLYNKTAVVTTPSFSASQELINHDIHHVQTIPWGVDTARFNPSHYSKEWRQKITGGKASNILLYVGRLVSYKDVDVLAETYTLLKKSRNDIAMVVVGEGPERQVLENQMPGAIFLGHQEGTALSTIYASSDIFLFPSGTEVFGRVTFEAIASNIIPILADTPTYALFKQKYGIGVLAKTKNASDFSEKIQALLGSETLRKEACESNNRALQHFSWPTVSAVFSNLYSKIISLQK